MIFGKHINKYYLKYGWILLLGIIALVAVDYLQLKIPEIYGTIINGLDPTTEFNLTKELLGDLCIDMLIVIAVLVVGRCLWRLCFFGSAIKVETDMRKTMFNHCKDLSQEINGKMGSLFSNNCVVAIRPKYSNGIYLTLVLLNK